MAFISVIIIVGLLCTFLGVELIHRTVPHVQDEVELDLNSAREIYQDHVSHLRDVIRLTAPRFFLRSHLVSGDLEQLSGPLEEIRRRESLDILNLADAGGNVRLRGGKLTANQQSQGPSEVIDKVLAEKKVVASTVVLPKEELLEEGKELAQRAYVKVVPTRHARSKPDVDDGAGMAIIAAAPILDDQGELLGVVYGGELLNRRNTIVDKVQENIYGEERYKGRELGAVTIFLGEKRIATTVTTSTGKRAIGTLVSEKVYRRVLVEGRAWTERAFGVDEWYLTAYEPIRDSSGKPVGILGLGLLERKFKDAERKALWTFLAVTFGGLTLSTAICFLLSRTIMRPITSLVHATENLGRGNLEERVELERSPLEIAALGRAFNTMVASIRERDERLQRQTQEELMRSDRLAMIGQLAAGVAHEINNPLGSILLFSRLLLQQAPAEGTVRQNLERIEKETKRCHTIVQSLLEFARQREPKIEVVVVNDLLEKTIKLFENQFLFHNIEVNQDYQPDLPTIHADPGQLQQVFMNIIINAADAMKGRGQLTITTRAAEKDGQVEISVVDTGCGIPPEEIQRIFEPFFTTKGVGHGTGLGLSVSYGIVQRHGGTLRVSSRVGKGSTFVVVLPRSKE